MVNTAHPAVDRVREALDAFGLAPEIRWFDDATPTAQAAAEALGIEVGAIANSLIFTLDGAPLLVLTSGAHRVDTAWLGEQLGGTIERASADTVKDATGQVIGGVAPARASGAHPHARRRGAGRLSDVSGPRPGTRTRSSRPRLTSWCGSRAAKPSPSRPD